MTPLYYIKVKKLSKSMFSHQEILKYQETLVDKLIKDGKLE